MTSDAAQLSARPPLPKTRIRGTRVTAVFAIVAALVVTSIVNPIAILAALVTGILNTASGGGAIVTFLALTATGVPALTAHATSQLVTPASFAGASRLATTHRPGTLLIVSGCAGTLIGVAVIAFTPQETFRSAAPFVLVPAAVLVVVQEPVKRLIQRSGHTIGPGATTAAMVGCGLYAGLIGVGTGTLALVVLGMTPALAGASLRDLLRTRNVLLLGMAILVSAAFAATGLADWTLAATLVLPGAVGGWIGARFVGHVPIPLLQAGVVLTAVAGAIWMVLR